MPNPTTFAPNPTVTYLTAGGSANLSRSATSTEAADRYIVFIASGSTTSVLSSCSINGVSSQIANSGNASFACAFVPTGTTVTAVPTFSSGSTGSSSMSALYAVYGLESPIWRSVTFGSGPLSASASITIPQGGLIFAPVWLNNDNQNPVFTGVTLDFEGNNGNSFGLATGHRDASDAGTYTVSVSIGSGTLYMGLGCLR